MSALIVVGLVVVLIVAAAVVVLTLRGGSNRGTTAPAPARTVADLVRMRADAAAGTSGSGTVESATSGTAAASTAEPAETGAPAPAPDRTPGAEAPAAKPSTTEPSTTGPGVDEPTTPPARAGSGRRLKPVGAGSAAKAPRPPGPDLVGADTPWHRAAVMAAGGGAGTWEPPAPDEPDEVDDADEADEADEAEAAEAPGDPVPVVAEPAPAPVVSAADGDGTGEAEVPATSTGWADWDEVDAEEAEAEAARAARRAESAHQAARPDRAHQEAPDRTPAQTRPPAQPDQVQSRREPAEPAQPPSPPAAPPPAAPPPAAPPPAEPAFVPGRDAPVVGNADPAPAPQPACSKIRTAREAAPAPVPTSPEPEAESMVRPVGRRTPEERAAEQAAADMALLRTFGFADASTRPDSAPVVAMVRPDAGATEPVDKGGAQPVRFHVVGRDGAPVPAAAVTLLDDRGLEVAAATAGADGRGEVLAPMAGTFALVATARGHQPNVVAVAVADEPVESRALLARSASVAGTVEGEDGPIAGARVTLVQDGEVIEAATTDDEGAYRLEDISSGEYGLSVAAAGFVPAAAMVEVSVEAELRHDVVMEPASPTTAYGSSGTDDEFDGFDGIDGMMGGQRFN